MHDPGEPAWRLAFVAPNGVRFTRTPDRMPRDRNEPANRTVDEAHSLESGPTLAEFADCPQGGESSPTMSPPLASTGPRACERRDAPPATAVGAKVPVFWHQDHYRVHSVALMGSLVPLAATNEVVKSLVEGTARIEPGPLQPPDGIEQDNIDLGYLALYVEEMPASSGGTIKPSDAKTPVLPPFQQLASELRQDERTPEASDAAVVGDTRAQPAEAPPLLPVSSAECLPQGRFSPALTSGYELPVLEYLAEPPEPQGPVLTDDVLEDTAGHLEKTIRDFGVKGEVVHVHPGPVVTLYELEPAPGTKSSRVIGLSDDIARSMSAVSARVAVVPGRNAIGIELPNARRETVYLRELLAAEDFESTKHKLALC